MGFDRWEFCGWAGGCASFFVFVLDYMSTMLLMSNEFDTTAGQRALHVGSLNERLRDMATDEFDPTSRQEELRKCDT